ncbi:PH domain-like protein [Mytilinidion resinicola]|uniref:PH domain-like protein n=1 Tax=Mytilinidion resinicola TaxID=574789 RepID=A0A6A6YSS4_9PEZI|nr:PH domain-like protein [Mytilinidion resinicola]KAF2811094.1 PH domain-like protein [Mytilinidion resinicola]
MASRKPKPPQNPPPVQASDYETDAPALLDLPTPPPRSNDELNLSVIRRHNPAVAEILSIAPYAVVYLFSGTTQQWEKCGIEGTLFICQLTESPTGAQRYCVTILNRRGLDNFYTELLSGDDVENTEDYIILQVTTDDAPKIYGLWIFSEPPPSSTANMRTMTAQLIEQCATEAEKSRKRIEMRGGGPTIPREEEETADEEEESVPMGRQLSLRELFGQQRAQDSGWSIQNHHSPVTKSGPFGSTPDTDFFRSNASYVSEPHTQPKPGQSVDLLGQLLQKTKHGYNGNG